MKESSRKQLNGRKETCQKFHGTKMKSLTLTLTETHLSMQPGVNFISCLNSVFSTNLLLGRRLHRAVAGTNHLSILPEKERLVGLISTMGILRRRGKAALLVFIF